MEILPGEVEQILEFLRSAEKLKDTLRSGYTTQGRPESTAEHTWRLCLLALLLENRYPAVDHHRLLKLCLVHDLGEALYGDTPAVHLAAGKDKQEAERSHFLELLAPLPPTLHAGLLALWDEYHAAVTPEARLAKAFDKLETLLQHTQGRNPPDFDYPFNLTYGRLYTDYDAMTQTLRAAIDVATRNLANAETRQKR